MIFKNSSRSHIKYPIVNEPPLPQKMEELMGTTENKQLVHDAFAALNAGNQDVFLSNLAEDVSWTIMGTTKYSINCVGKKELTDKLFAPLASQLDGFITNTILNTVAEGDYVVIQTHGKSRTKAGKT